MLTLSSDQWSDLERGQGQAFLARLKAHFLATFAPLAEMPDPELQATLMACQARAQAIGFVTERQIASFCVASFLLGADFQTVFPIAGKRLSNPTLSAETKRVWLEEWTVALFDRVGSGPELRHYPPARRR